MKKNAILILSLVMCAGLFATERVVPLFVSTQWLSDNLHDPNLVVLQVGFTRADYNLGHIPNSRFLWFSWLAEDTPDLNTEMPSVEEAAKVLGDLGISHNSKIVICFTGQNITITTRMLLALSYYGFGDAVSFLDGGFTAWKDEGRPVSTETPTVTRTSLKLTINPSVITDADWVKANLSSPNVAIVDSRAKRFYDGNGGGVRRQGHIKGAVNIQFSDMVDSTNHLKSAAALQKYFDDAGIKKGTKVVTYCHVGQQATLVYAVAKMLGYDAAVYDGCFEDWNVRSDDYPVENPSMK